MKAWIASVLALSVGLAACQNDGRTPTGAATVQEDFLTLVLNPVLTDAQRAFLATIRDRPSTAEVHVARLVNAPGRLLQQGRVLRLSVAPGRQILAIGERVEQRAANDISWTGSVQGEPGTVQMVLSGKGVTATVRAGETWYHIEPLGSGLHAITRIDPTRLPPDHPPGNPSGAAEFSGGNRYRIFRLREGSIHSICSRIRGVIRSSPVRIASTAPNVNRADSSPM